MAGRDSGGPAVSHPASSRVARPVPPLPAANDPDQQRSPRKQ